MRWKKPVVFGLAVLAAGAGAYVALYENGPGTLTATLNVWERVCREHGNGPEGKARALKELKQLRHVRNAELGPDGSTIEITIDSLPTAIIGTDNCNGDVGLESD